jgi:hypothetical protein
MEIVIFFILCDDGFGCGFVLKFLGDFLVMGTLEPLLL